MTHFLYIIKSEKDGSFYVGTTNNLEDRVSRNIESEIYPHLEVDYILWLELFLGISALTFLLLTIEN